MTKRKILVHDMTLRDGMHPKRHQISLDQMRQVAQGLDAAGVPLIEVTHGDGLVGSSVNYGFPSHTDEEYLSTVIPLMKRAKVSALLIPGIGTADHLRMARDLGVHTIRVATHCTEADVSEQHIKLARSFDMDTVGFLVMAHMASPQKLAEQTKLMESYGANCVYVTDSADCMLPEDVSQRIRAVREAMKPETEVGFTVITTSLWASPIPSLLWKPVLRESMQRRLAWVQAQAIHRWKSSLLSA
jgi:4-hydroxy-2-oxovalerate/4-hydroxy-2-oxohexanoate aldolase